MYLLDKWLPFHDLAAKMMGIVTIRLICFCQYSFYTQQLSRQQDLDTVEQGQLRWSVEQRLEFIETVLFWQGTINRSDLMARFGVSVPQASADIKKYREVAPGNMEYDGTLKRYVATVAFAPALIEPSAEDYLSSLRGSEGHEVQPPYAPPFDDLKLPERRVLPNILRNIVHAIKGRQAIRIRYQSMSRPKPTWRWVTPLALGDNGRRWHFRALCHIDDQFKDFLFYRIIKSGETRPSEVNPDDDKEWYDEITVVFVPNPALSKTQQEVVKHDYSMKRGKLSVTTRPAMLPYYLRHLGIDGAAHDQDALLALKK